MSNRKLSSSLLVLQKFWFLWKGQLLAPLFPQWLLCLGCKLLVACYESLFIACQNRKPTVFWKAKPNNSLGKRQASLLAPDPLILSLNQQNISLRTNLQNWPSRLVKNSLNKPSACNYFLLCPQSTEVMDTNLKKTSAQHLHNLYKLKCTEY